MNEIIDAIQVVGFPIVAFILMYIMANRTIKENSSAINELVNELKRRGL